MQEFERIYKVKQDLINNYILSYFPDTGASIPDPLYGAMKYEAEGQGKRLRPIIMLSTSELFDTITTEVLPFAAAIELIHTYSLVHDDLPCMDNDEMRRNRPTCHMIYGDGMAMLTGDALLNFAYEIIFDNTLIAKDVRKYLKAAAVLARAAGARGMIAGQCYDLKFASSDTVTENDLMLVHKNKTSKMIEAAVQCGAILGEAEEDQEKALLCYAEKIGLAFQIIDDILDVEGDSKLLGKPTGKDVADDKLTFPKIYGLEQSKKLANRYTEEAIEYLSHFNGKADFLAHLAQYMLERNN